MADRPMDSQPQPSLPQGAQNVHKPAAAAPGRLVGHLQIKDLDLHYKPAHWTRNDLLNLESAPPANNTIFSTVGESSQPLSIFSPNANLGSNAVGALVHGPFFSHVDPNQSVPTYPCLFPHCVSTFQNAEDLDLHYKQVHRTPHDVLNLEDVFSTPGEPSQPLSSFRPNANLGSNDAIVALVHGPFVSHVDYNDITVTEHDRRLLTETPNASSYDGRMHPSSPSLSLADMFSFNNEQHSFVSSDANGDQLNTLALPPLVPIEAVSTTASPAVSHLTSGTLSISSPAPIPQAPTTGAVPAPRHVCATCGKSFSRAPDMQRHAKKHNPAARRIDCPVPGCLYKGAKGFLRRDKLASHRQNRH